MRYIKTVILIILCIFVLASCGAEKSALGIVEDVRERFAFKYGAVYSDEYGEWDAYCFTTELKKTVLGKNAEKYSYVKAISGYFARDMVSGSEFIAVELSDRSHRAEVMSMLYRRAALKLDSDARVFCEGNFVFLVCDSAAEEIIEYVRDKM
ncbi:MAG: hypothetical protein IJX55_03150 [Clostridia bacterium]|nr:hypothetical protein [Clostridia bacterium]